LAREAEVLSFLLEPEFPGVEALRRQAETARVVRQCECGCATIDLATDPAAPAAEGVREPNVVEARGRARDDGRPPPELILFVRDGRLSSVEIVSYDEPIFDVFPAPEEFEEPHAYRFA
jgi:hypothetical protein